MPRSDDVPQKQQPGSKRARRAPDASPAIPDAADSVVAADPAVAPAEPVDARPAPHATPFPIVGIGASAGGLAAFEAFFSGMPKEGDSGMAFVLVQHLSPDHKSLLAELVKRYTHMVVREAGNDMPVEPNCTYIIPPNHDLTLADGRLWLAEHGGTHGPRLTIDHFFRSLAAAQHERAICVVLSGAGSDGTLGLRAVKGEGGLVLAQAPDSTEHDSMPRSAIATGMVDYVLPPAEMAEQLIAYARHAFDPARGPAGSSLRDSVLKKVCALLHAQTGHDFSQYKETTLIRRMERRMALHQIQRPDDYLRYARENAPELDALFRDLLIGVTNFFRDPEAFKLLDEQVIPRLLANKPAHEAIRVWVCGCSTGEEAYSIAILLHEHVLKSKRAYRIQVFATDIDARAIEQARIGAYPVSIAADVPEARLQRYFSHDAQHGTYRIQKHIRDLLVFSEQDVIKDPPFSRLDLVSCRNLLIYLGTDVQKRLIPLFHYALVPGGALFLGTSETVGESARLFEVADRKWKLYFRLADENGAPRPSLAEFVPPLVHAGASAPVVRTTGEASGGLRQVTEQALLAHFGPAGVLIDARGQILHIVGRTGQFLEPAAGDAEMNILAMARDGLRRELTTALHKAVAHREVVAYTGLRVRAHGEPVVANLTLRPVELRGGSLAYLVVLQEVPERERGSAGAAPGDVTDSERVAELELELRAKDEYLQTTLEEMETTNEELKSTNEEMQSVNEELQSTNEELETSKEELQSVNEELSTVNAELQDKVAELSRANDDMNNLLAGTGVGTLFVDHALRITRFTPAATQVVNLIPGDVGRPLEHVVANVIGYDDMVADIRAVLDTLVPKEAEIQVRKGGWYLMRIRPYRTIENVIEGAVVTLVDISERKKAEQALRRSETRLNALIGQAYAGVAETDFEGRFLLVNERLCETLGFGRDELLQRRLRDVVDPGDAEAVQAQLEALADGGPDLQVERRYLRKDGTRVRMHERACAIRDADGKPSSLLSVTFDLSDRPHGVPGADDG
jgi:two-component system CheB/CheR fusion protein